MVKTILLVFLLIFAVLGLCELIYVIKMLFYYPCIKFEKYILIALNNNFAIRQLNFIWQKIKWLGDEYATGVIALTDSLETKEILCCNKFIIGKNIVLCNLKSLSQCEYLQGDL